MTYIFFHLGHPRCENSCAVFSGTDDVGRGGEARSPRHAVTSFPTARCYRTTTTATTVVYAYRYREAVPSVPRVTVSGTYTHTQAHARRSPPLLYSLSFFLLFTNGARCTRSGYASDFSAVWSVFSGTCTRACSSFVRHFRHGTSAPPSPPTHRLYERERWNGGRPARPPRCRVNRLLVEPTAPAVHPQTHRESRKVYTRNKDDDERIAKRRRTTRPLFERYIRII